MRLIKCPVCGSAQRTNLQGHLVALEGALDETAHLIAEGNPDSDQFVTLRDRYRYLRLHCDALVRAMDAE